MAHVGSREREFSIIQKQIAALLDKLDLPGLWLGLLSLHLLLG